MAELHIIGEMHSGTGFPENNLYCKFSVVSGSAWTCLGGRENAQTHVDYPTDGRRANWGHPIDLHFAASGLQGWPKIHFEVWHQDSYGRNELYGYGFCHIPTSPGYYELSCAAWKPAGTISEQISSFFLGGGPQLKSPDLVYSGTDRYRLRTVATGKVELHLNVILRNFKKFGVEY